MEYSVTSIGSSAFKDCSGLTSITIPNSVTNIGSSVFYGCTGLTSITIPNSVTRIESSSFYGCTGLNSITIPNSVTSIGSYAFYSCSGLTSITIPNSVVEIGSWAFYNTAWLNNHDDGVIYAGKVLYEYKGVMPEGTIITIEEGTVSITNNAFYECVSLKDVSIPNSVKTIGIEAFCGCISLNSITIPNSVISVGFRCFCNCLSLTDIYIGGGLVNLDELEGIVFDNCPNVERIAVDSQNIVFDSRNECNAIIKTESNELLLGCKNTIIPDGVTVIGKYAFCGCTGLTSVILPNSVTSIGYSAFRGCTGLASVTIPNSVTSIGYSAFLGCTGLTIIIVEQGNTYYDSREGCNAIIETSSNALIFGCKNTSIPNSVTSIGDGAFYGCTGLTSITIPNSVTSIESSAFSGCTGLTSITIPNSVTSIGGKVFYQSGLTSVSIGSGVNGIGYQAFEGCQYLTKVICKAEQPPSTNGYIFGDVNVQNATLFVPSASIQRYKQAYNWKDFGTILAYEDLINGVVGDIRYRVDEDLKTATVIGLSEEGLNTNDIAIPSTIEYDGVTYNVTIIGYKAFDGCTNLNTVTIPNSVTSIKSDAFHDCTGLTCITMGNNVEYIGSNALPSCILYVNRGTKSLLALWNYGRVPTETGSTNLLYFPNISVITTQTTATIQFDNVGYEGYTYTYGEEVISGETRIIRGLKPEYSDYTRTFKVSLDNVSYERSVKYTTSSIGPFVNLVKTASSVTATGSYIHGDAQVTRQYIKMNGQTVDDNTIKATGLTPNTNYNATYYIEVPYGENGEYTATYSRSTNIATNALTLTTQQPKVISPGNVIVAAESNLDDEETNVGFEWRRTDWPDDFASNTGGAYLYESTMEGYIRNLYTEKLWKYRPYYESNSGNRYYGEWVGIDPTNTSYFEPTVHTYAQVQVQGNTAQVKGYAMRGTDNVTSQGFMYWKSAAGARGAAMSNIPSDAMTVEASGQVMTAQLTGLDYETDYCYVAFVKTSEGETFYGEQQLFRTGPDTSGIESTELAEDVTVVARYDMRGRRLDTPQPGINILMMSDGTTRKVVVR